MSLMSKEIRDAIKEFLENEGTSKSGDIIRYITEEREICSPKPCYRELKFLVNANEVREITVNKSRTDYELVSNDRTHSEWMEYFNSRLIEFDKQQEEVDRLVDRLTDDEKISVISELMKFLDYIKREYYMMKLIVSFSKSRSFTALEKEFEKKNVSILHTMFHHKLTKKNNSKLFSGVRASFSYDQAKCKDSIFHLIHRPD